MQLAVQHLNEIYWIHIAIYLMLTKKIVQSCFNSITRTPFFSFATAAKQTPPAAKGTASLRKGQISQVSSDFKLGYWCCCWCTIRWRNTAHPQCLGSWRGRPQTRFGSCPAFGRLESEDHCHGFNRRACERTKRSRYWSSHQYSSWAWDTRQDYECHWRSHRWERTHQYNQKISNPQRGSSFWLTRIRRLNLDHGYQGRGSVGPVRKRR